MFRAYPGKHDSSVVNVDCMPPSPGKVHGSKATASNSSPMGCRHSWDCHGMPPLTLAMLLAMAVFSMVSLSYMSQAHATAALHTLPEHPASMHDDVRHPASVQAYAHRTGVSMPASSSGSSSSMEVLLTAVLQQNVKLEQIAQKVSALAGGGGSGGSSGGSSSSAASKDSATAVAPLAPPHHVGQTGGSCHPRNSRFTVPKGSKLVAPVVIVAYQRVNYLAKTLVTLLRYWESDASNRDKFPLYVSIDAGVANTSIFAQALNYATGLQVIHNERDPEDCRRYRRGHGYCLLSQHYLMLLELFFECHKVPRLLFLEEDLQVAPDFFSYFSALAPVMDRDPTLWCVSAWNDHGQKPRVRNATALMRTDIMPGLGWMLPASVALELIPKWPNAYWDDWMREVTVSKGRQCVFPEVSRTYTFGSSGTSGGFMFSKHLKDIALNEENVDWSKQNLSYIGNTTYNATMARWLAAAEPVAVEKAHNACRAGPELPANQSALDMVTYYEDVEDFQDIAKGIPPMMTDIRGGRPRASYNGTVMVRCRGRRLFLTPGNATQIGNRTTASQRARKAAAARKERLAAHSKAKQESHRRWSWRGRDRDADRDEEEQKH